MLMMSACTSDIVNNNYLETEAEENGIAFNSVVVSSQQATRADGTILNRSETALPENAEVGIFGVYTGQNTWSSLVLLSKVASPTTEETTTLNTYYSANQLYNSKATVGADGKSLSYSPLRFWPNNVLTSGVEAGQHEYMTFWAYYPYNATSTMGDYGIAITESTLGAGMGMGRVKFTMHPDAAQQNDFLISAPVTDCNRDKYPLERTADDPAYNPKPVQFRLYHMLAQVRFYAYVIGRDKINYYTVDGKTYKVKAEDTGYIGQTVKDAYGKDHTLVVGDSIPDDATCLSIPDPETQRWSRTAYTDVDGNPIADITYKMEFNNLKTSATFYPNYDNEGKNATIAHDEPTALGSATINKYIMNPYWFTFKDNERERLNDNYMFDYYEDTPVAKNLNATTTMVGYDDVDGVDWKSKGTDPLHYLSSKTDEQKNELKGKGTNSEKHYNFAPGNILLVVPQALSDDDVPHVVITATDNTNSKTAKVTINMLKMGISWESGYIYCYAFLDDLRPGDDKVRGPESITVLFNTAWHTDQW